MVKRSKNRRPLKGYRVTDFPNDFVVVDIETTGLDPQYDQIIEIGAIKVINGAIFDTFSSLCYADCGIDDFITNLTGITTEMLSTAPPLDDVLFRFSGFIGELPLIGHNVHFDINFLYDNFLNLMGAPLTNNYLDTLWLSRKLFKDLPNYKLQTLMETFGLTSEYSHRSLVDCTSTLKCLNYMQRYMSENHFELSLFTVGHCYARSKDIVCSKNDIDPSNILFGRICVFTGTLEKMTRREAMQAVVDCGGICNDYVTKKTNFLILGNYAYCSTIKDGKSAKHKAAEKLILSGQDLRVVSENVFYDMLED